MTKRRKYSEFNLLKGRIRERNTSYRKLSEGIGIAVNNDYKHEKNKAKNSECDFFCHRYYSYCSMDILIT